MIRKLLLLLLTVSASSSGLVAQKKPISKKDTVSADTSRPNIIVIMPDDVGYWNVGAYNNGMMVPTPNIDRIAREGILFTDHYSAPTCTPG
jgi:arylsulfatase A-like enzyme